MEKQFEAMYDLPDDKDEGEMEVILLYPNQAYKIPTRKVQNYG